VLVHVLWVGLYAGWCDPGRCLSVQIFCIPGKSNPFCYTRVAVFSVTIYLTRGKRIDRLNAIASLLPFLSF